MRFVLGLIFLLMSTISFGQELRANVNLNIPKLQLTDPGDLRSLEGDINDFLNNQAFTNESYEDYQKIECEITINITSEAGNGVFNAELLIQSNRPVYESSYKSVLLSYIDKDITFNYEPSMPIRYIRDGYENMLSSILSYWALVIIAIDHDSFAPQGGEPFYLAAQTIINNVVSQSGGGAGWQANQNKPISKYYLIENMLSPRCEDFRNGIYTYHRKGLDVLTTDVGIGQQNILTSLEAVSNLRSSYPSAMVIQLFSDAKTDEVAEVLSNAAPQIKSQAYARMLKISPNKRANLEPLRR